LPEKQSQGTTGNQILWSRKIESRKKLKVISRLLVKKLSTTLFFKAVYSLPHALDET
jgi:hypothetical protein